MGTIDGPNMYAFVRNNPIKYVDYFGFNSQLDPNCGCTQHGHPGWHNAPLGCVCICGRDGRSEAPTNSYRSKMGSDIKSVLGGIGHGAVDFLVGSLHDLQTAAVCIGSAELEMSLHERTNMIEAVEQSQMHQMAAVGSRLMGMMEMDRSNLLYQSFRSKTTMGLEIGSLVAGGCGAVKGVIAFNRLAKIPTQLTKAAKFGGQLKWPSPAKGRSVVNGIECTTHALERMAPRGLIQSGTEIISRGVPPSVVENAINFGTKTLGNTPQEIVHVFENVRVVTDLNP